MPKERELKLETLGWNSEWQQKFAALNEPNLHAARVAVEDKLGYIVFSLEGELRGQVTGKFLHNKASRAEFPKVGDWVAISMTSAENKSAIHHVLPRRTKLARKIAGREIEEQVLVTNVDIAFIVQALDGTFNARFLERQLMMVIDGGIKPIVVLNKSDLCKNLSEQMRAVEKAAGNAPIMVTSAKTGRSVDSVTKLIHPGETVVFIGPSGVGKSTLINQIFGDDIQPTMEVRENDFKGRHMTSWRELIVLPGGGLVIDTPGMREFHMWLSGGSVQDAFPDIEQLSLKCHFTNCTHTSEKKCAVQEALTNGTLPRERFDNFLKLQQELEFLQNAQRGGRLRVGKERQVRFTRKTRR